MANEKRLLAEAEKLTRKGNQGAARKKALRIQDGSRLLMKRFAQFKQEILEAKKNANKANNASKRLSSEMASIGGKDPQVEKTLAGLNESLRSLEDWEASATAAHKNVMARLASVPKYTMA
mmetsp:Transcript_45545/g.83680  ORF Transcript_45545/g.83680 Transcript_45545/m.83680 type:complete len:121 (+) Transcript_45545:2-364(+)